MLGRKAWRELRQNFGQFFSLFLLVMLAAMLYAGFMSDPIGGGKARAKFHEVSNLASGWMYGENFSQENVDAVRELSFVDSAQARIELTGSAPEQGGAQMDLYLEKENIVNKPQTVSGVDFDPSDPDGLWINRNFADEWGIRVGDLFTIEYNGVTFAKEVKGIILSPEYEYMCASTDADTNFANIGYAFMDYDGFPVREYITHLMENEKITVADIEKETDLQSLLPYTQLIVRVQEGVDILEKESEIAQAVDHNYAVLVDEHSIAGIERLSAELAQHAGFSYVFMVIFVAIALLVIATSMSRMVERQRVQIGTMNALGVSRRKIAMHYMSYSFWVSLAGGIVGIAIGYFLLGAYVVEMFQMWYVVPDWKAGADWTYGGMIVLITAVCVLASWFSCRRLLKVAPSEALRPAPPKKGKRTLFEKLPFWEKLGFSARYNLRDISRYKMRAVMGVFGTAVGMLLLTGTMSALTMLDLMYDWTFEKIQNFSYEAFLSEDMKLSDAEKLCGEMDGELVMQAPIEVARTRGATNKEKSTQSLTVIEGKGLYQVTDSRTIVTTLPQGTAAITRRLADKMGIGVGDTVYWHIYEENTWHESVIGVINRTPETSGLTLYRKDYEKTGSDYVPSLLATNDVSVLGTKTEGVSAVYGIEELRDIYEENMQIIWVLVVAMVVFAVVMIVVVLYNSGNLSFHERIQEFATLKVLGFSAGQIRSLLTRQNFWLSIAGIVIGAPFGKAMLEAMMNSNGDNFDYYAEIMPSSYLLAGAFVLAVSMAVSFLFTGKIRRLDMVGTLKGAE